MTSDLIHQKLIACPPEYPHGKLFNQAADALERAETALQPLADAVFNDNGDMTQSAFHSSARSSA